MQWLSLLDGITSHPRLRFCSLWFPGRNISCAQESQMCDTHSCLMQLGKGTGLQILPQIRKICGL